MRSGWVAVACMAACYRHIDLASRDGAPTDGAGSDSELDAPRDAGPLCFGHSPPEGLIKVCPTTTPAPFDVQAIRTINTDDPSMCEMTAQVDGGGPDVCVIVATTVQISALLKAQGTHPLVIAATGPISVSAPISVGSHFNVVKAGAGGGRDCGSSQGGDSANGGGGGAGGSFSSTGGMGGGTLGTGSAAAGLPMTPLGLIGGCNGGAGGKGGNPTTALAGYGGGAIALLGLGSMQLGALIDADGAGGIAGAQANGGAGGGAGGMIVLDAPMITYSGTTLAAVGGGGGQGGDAAPGVNGADGNGTTGGTGGGGTGNGGHGGTGAAMQNAGSGATTACQGCGGGGGGGGIGYIYVKGQTTGTAVAVPGVILK